MAVSARRPFGLGWVPDLPDHRDLAYSAPLARLRALPGSVNLRNQFPWPPYDQGPIGSCTANAIAGAIQFDRAKDHQQPDFTPSRLFIYYNERAMEHSIAADAGAMIRDGIKSVAKQGACKEATWPYEPVEADPQTHLFPSHSPPRTKPPASAYHEALQYKAVAYYRLQQSLAQMKGCLAEGFPFVLGFTVYDSLYDASGNPRTCCRCPAAPIMFSAVTRCSPSAMTTQSSFSRSAIPGDQRSRTAAISTSPTPISPTTTSPPISGRYAA